jgi:hypothetical protein
MAEKPMELRTENLELEGGATHLGHVPRTMRGIRKAVVREQDDASNTEPARRLHVLDDLR